MKKFGKTFILFLLCLLLTCGCTQRKKEGSPSPQKVDKNEIVVGIVTDVGGLGDQSFNDSAHKGLKQAEEEEEGSFLCEVVAGMMTKSDKDGFIGGMDIPTTREDSEKFTL